MGIYDREYYREEGGNWGGWANRGATPWLVGITCAIWIAQLATRNADWGGVTALGVYDPVRILNGEVWRLLTPVFLHSEGQLAHIVFNMLVLYWIGSRLEDRYGAKEFLAFYLCAGLFAQSVQFAAHVGGLMPLTRGLGASGAVTAAFVLYACLEPRQQILVMFVIPMPIWVAAVVYVGLDCFGALGVRVDRGETIAYLVHLGGALFGAIYYLTGIRLSAVLPSGRRGGTTRARVQPRLRVVPPDDADTDDPVVSPPPPPPDERFEERVDRLLEKVSKHGQESLTSEERELLFRAGEHYKKRRR